MNKSKSIRFFVIAITALGIIHGATPSAHAQEYLTGIEWPEPPIITPGKTDSEPPSDAVVLFNGKDLSAWNGNWRIEDGATAFHAGRPHQQAIVRRLPVARRMVVADGGPRRQAKAAGTAACF